MGHLVENGIRTDSLEMLSEGAADVSEGSVYRWVTNRVTRSDPSQDLLIFSFLQHIGSSAVDFHRRTPFGLESSFKQLVGTPGIDRIATCEDIDGSVLMFWPGMNGQMALLKGQGPCHTAGRKTVKRFTDDRGARLTRSYKQLLADEDRIIQECPVAAIQID